jgi:hypothetical protein
MTVENILAPRIRPSIPQVNKLERPSSDIGKFRSLTCLRYIIKAVANAKIYISPYQRTGSPGIISGFSHEGNGMDNSIFTP